MSKIYLLYVGRVQPRRWPGSYNANSDYVFDSSSAGPAAIQMHNTYQYDGSHVKSCWGYQGGDPSVGSWSMSVRVVGSKVYGLMGRGRVTLDSANVYFSDGDGVVGYLNCPINYTYGRSRYGNVYDCTWSDQ